MARHTHAGRRGFTLIETLLALLIALLVLTVVYASWNTAVRVTQDWTARTADQEERHTVLSQLTRDLTHLARTSDRRGTALLLTPEGRLEATILRSATAEDPLGHTLWHLTYTRSDDRLNRQEWALNRALGEADTKEPPVVADRVTEFSLLFFDGKTWCDRWNSEEQGWPQAAQLRLQIDGAPLQEALIWIPIGQTFTPAPVD